MRGTLQDCSSTEDVVAGMGGVITTKQRNIEELGFPQELHRSADGVFLDLPGPWHVSSSPFLQLYSSTSSPNQSLETVCAWLRHRQHAVLFMTILNSRVVASGTWMRHM